ncbi:MAG: hypothetical protein ABSC55_02290 [Syntrophorhabdales bacterium]
MDQRDHAQPITRTSSSNLAGQKVLTGLPWLKDCFFDLSKLSDYSSLSVRTLRDYLSDPSDPIPSYCIRRKILVRKSEFDAWIEKHKTDRDGIAKVVDDVLNELIK